MSRLVDGDSPEAAFQLVAKGGEIPEAEVKRLGLVLVDGRVRQPAHEPKPAPVVAKSVAVVAPAVVEALKVEQPKAEKFEPKAPKSK